MIRSAYLKIGFTLRQLYSNCKHLRHTILAYDLSQFESTLATVKHNVNVDHIRGSQSKRAHRAQQVFDGLKFGRN